MALKDIMNKVRTSGQTEKTIFDTQPEENTRPAPSQTSTGQSAPINPQGQNQFVSLPIGQQQPSEIVTSTDAIKEIDPSILADIITSQCDVENLCSQDVIDSFASGTIPPADTGVARESPSAAAGIPALGQGMDSQVGNEPLVSALTLLQSSFGKKNTYIISNVLGLTYNDFVQASPLSDRSMFCIDPFRGRLGSYWSLGPESLKIQFLREKVKTRSLIDYETNPIRFTNLIEGNYETNLDFGYLEEKYKVLFRENSFRDAADNLSKDLIDKFSSGGQYQGSIIDIDESIEIDYPATFIQNTDFTDIHYDFYTPYSEKQLQEVQTPASSLVYSIKPDYNFYIKSYENLLSSTNIVETDLPSLYILSAKQKLINPSPNIRRIISLDGKIPTSNIPSISPSSEDSTLDFAGQYFDEYSIAYPKTDALFRATNLAKLKNIIFSSKKIKELTSLNEKKRMFPMYVDLEFTTGKSSKFSAILNDTKLTEKITAKIVDKISKNEFQQIKFLVEKTDISRTTAVSNFTEFLSGSATDVRYVELSEIIREIRQESVDLIELTNTTILDDFEEIEKTQTTEEKQFIDTLYFAIFRNKMTDLLKQTFRTHDDLLKGKSSYNEAFLYRIAKYKGGQPTGEPVQNIYFPNSPELDIVKYVDTQVHYDQEYTYVVYAYQIVIGNRYRYTNLEDGLIAQEKNYTVKNEPYIIVTEVPFLAQATRVYDSPPPPPEVNIVAYKDQDNKVLLMLNSSANTYKSKPIIIEKEDESVFQKISESQDISFGQPIEFSSDDRISAYQVYRLENKPSSFEDFTGNLLTQVTTDVSLESIQQASSAAYLDSVEPNKKYYYMFRSIDIHGKPSNPSQIYEMEIISENGTIFPLIKSILLAEENDKTQTRGVKRFIQVIPSVLQTILNEDDEKYNLAKTGEEAIQQVNLGISDNSVWNKRFKIRLVSKQTKKIVDFDVQFDFATQKLNKKGK